MKNRHAFTLIEVLVVLSILAMIAILSYNFFGSTMKDAQLKQQVTKIYNDLRTLDDAASLYFLKTGTILPDAPTAISSGVLKSLPTPPSGLAPAYSHSITYAKYPDNNDAGDTTGSDPAWSVAGSISDELCAAFNEHVGLGAGFIQDNTAVEIYPAPYSCVTWDATANSNNEIIGFFHFD